MEKQKENEVGKKIERLVVYLKVKQPNEKDKLYYKISEDKTLISLYDKVIKVDSSKTQKIEVDKIFDESQDEKSIYNEICNDCIDGSIDGNNYTYIFYGDSTSEKNELIVGNNKKGTKGTFHLLLSDFYSRIKKNQSLSLYLSFLMVNGSLLIDLSKLMNKKKSLESITEKDLLNKYGKEININDTDIIKDVQRIPCNNVEENTNFISNLFYTLKKLEENDSNLFLSWSYFCFSIYIVNKKSSRTVSTINFIVIPGNELLTTKITNPNNAKRENIANTKNVVELSYTIEDIVRHLSTQSMKDKNEKENMNRSKFMAVIGKIAFDVGNSEAQFDRKYRILGSIYANTGLYYNTKDTLYFLFRCKKITRQKLNLDMALSLLEHDKKRQNSKFRVNSSRTENIIVNTKNELEEKLKIKDDQIYDLESKLKLQETKVAELNARLENKDINLKSVRDNYKKQIECLKEALGFKGDVNILLSKDQYTKEYRYALNIRNTMKTNRAKAEIIEKLEEKIKELNKEKIELKKILEDKEKEKALLRIINNIDKNNNNLEDNTNDEGKEKKGEIYEKKQIIKELKLKNEELEKELEQYSKENNDNIKIIHNLPTVIDANIKKFKVESTKVKENNEIIKKKFIEEAKNISIKSDEERKKIIEKYEHSIMQNQKEISNQNKIINEFEQKNEKEIRKCVDELLRLHKNLMNITYGYKNSFNDLYLNRNIKSTELKDSNNNATNQLYMQKEAFEKILENEVKMINNKQYPILFEQLKKRGENILDIFKRNNFEKNEGPTVRNNNYDEENEKEEKKTFKFFEGHEKKTEKEIDNMNKDQLIHYSKKILNRVSEIETYLDKYIQYKKGYKLSEEDEYKINDYNLKLNKANDLLNEATAKYNKSKIFIEKNNTIIEQLNRENILLKKKLNDKITLEKLTYPSFMHITQNNNHTHTNISSNKKTIKDNLINYETRTLPINKRKTNDKYFNLEKEGKKTYSNFSLSQNNKKRPDSYRCTTYNTKNIIKKKKRVTFSDNSKTVRPFSSFQHIKITENN